MAVIIETKSRNHIKNPFFTDETQYLTGWYQDSGQPIYNGTNEPEKVYYGMSFYKPNELLANPMVIPFQEIEIRDYNVGSDSDVSYYLIYEINWDISAYQKSIRGHLSEFNQSDIYFYAKALSPNGHEYISWQLCNVTIIDVKAPIYTVSPKYTITDSLSTSLTGNSTTLIRYVTDVNVTFTAETQKESTFVSYTVKNGSQSINSTNILNKTTASVSQAMTNVESPTFYIVVEDSRGIRTNNFAQANGFIDYFYPTTHIKVDGISSTGGATPLTVTGIAFNSSFGSRSNSITVQYRYKVEGGSYSSWRSMTTTRNGNNYTSTASVSGLDYQETYTFQSRITDAVTTVEGAEFTTKLMPIFDWGKNDFRFNVPVNIDGDLIVNGIITSNTEEEDPGASDYETGTWTPVCNMVTNPDYAYGYYTRIGDICTINFYFEGEITVNPKQNVFLYFTGLPFTPDSYLRWQAGGGNCTGYARHTGGSSRGVNYSYHAFSGWSIEDGRIYGRMSSWASVEGNSYREDLGSGHYQNYKTADTARYITGVVGDTLYASGTISYKIDN